LGLLGCSLVAVLLAGSGAAAHNLETTIQDDALMLHRPEAQVRATARQMAELGADRVRLTASWNYMAPAPRAKKKPKGDFDPGDSKTYPELPWDKLDRAVRATESAGMAPMIDIAFWAPRWAVAKKGPQRDRQRFIPKPSEFASFASALAKRYSGSFPDPRRKGRKLPPVRVWTTWNEPNHSSFLAPQWKRDGKGGFRPFSPHVYRPMHEAAYDAIKAVSTDNTVLIGGTTSIGSDVPGKGHVAPLEFLRTLACVDRLMQPLAVRECDGVGPLRADGFAHHPYSLYTTPGVSAVQPDNAPIADIGRLGELIDQLFAAGRINQDWPLYLTEYGYETKPPDPFAKFTAEQQARNLAWANWLAYKRGDVRMHAQFLLRDIDSKESGFPSSSKRHWRDWQTGLLFADGSPKPGASAFKVPLHLQFAQGPNKEPALMVWGGVRPGTGQRIVRLERQDPGVGWRTILTSDRSCNQQNGEFLTLDDGFFSALAAWEGPGTYRLGFRHGDGAWEYGAEVTVDAEQPLGPTGV
jgi:hypothetical protein